MDEIVVFQLFFHFTQPIIFCQYFYNFKSITFYKMSDFEDECDGKVEEFALYRAEVFARMDMLKSLMANFTILHKQYLIIFARNDIVEKQDVFDFVTNNYLANLYYMMDMCVLFYDGRLIRNYQKTQQKDSHKTELKNYFNVSSDSKKSAVSLTLLSILGFEFERDRLKKMYSGLKIKFVSFVLFSFILLIYFQLLVSGKKLERGKE